MIDSKHVAMWCQKNTRSLYHNYKGFFSQVLLAVCDAKYKFIFIDVRQCESTIDTSVLRSFEFGKRRESNLLNIHSEENYLKDGKPFILSFYKVGIEIFQLKDYLKKAVSQTYLCWQRKCYDLTRISIREKCCKNESWLKRLSQQKWRLVTLAAKLCPTHKACLRMWSIRKVHHWNNA